MSNPNSPRLSTVSAMNERIKKQLADHNNDYANSLKIEHDRLLNGLDAILHIRANHNIAETPAAHTLRLAKAANKLKDENMKVKQKALNIYVEYDNQINAAMIERTGMNKQSPYASEIRAAFKALDMKERTAYLNQLTESGDGSTFAVIMDAPEILTGIPRAMNKDFSSAFFSKAAPDLVKQQQDLKSVMDMIEITIREIDYETTDYSNPETVRQIEADIQKSQEAQTRFDTAMG